MKNFARAFKLINWRSSEMQVWEINFLPSLYFVKLWVMNSSIMLWKQQMPTTPSKKDKKQGKTMIFSFYDIISLISLIVNACSHQITTFKEYLNDFNRTIGLSTSRYNSVRKYLMFDTKTLHDIFNAGIRSTLNVRWFLDFSIFFQTCFFITIMGSWNKLKMK